MLYKYIYLNCGNLTPSLVQRSGVTIIYYNSIKIQLLTLSTKIIRILIQSIP